MSEIVIALAGNPNSGKTTIFNQLTGAHQKVGNWPGVTVEKKEGEARFRDFTLKVVDLPGIYSFSAYSLEEVIARNFILEESPRVIVNVVDASNLERNLYLTVQLLEFGKPMVVALNMIDVAKSRGLYVDVEVLSRLLGVPVVPTVGTKRLGIEELVETVVQVALGKKKSQPVNVYYGREIEEALREISEKLSSLGILQDYPSRWVALKLLEGDREILNKVKEEPAAEELLLRVKEISESLTRLFDETPEALIVEARYGFISGAVREAVRVSAISRKTLSERLDDLLTHRLLGFPIFILFMYLLFYLTFKLGAYPVAWLEHLLEASENLLRAKLPPGLLREILVEGVLGGVGGVLVYLPNILFLFLGISLFEDTGYLARAAFIMDRVMHSLGLHGKSFIPLLMGFGCNVPAILATRTLENPRERILTILINPLMSCSARFPVYVLFAGTFFRGHETPVVFGLYALGIILAALIARLFGRILVKEEDTPFVLELPPYRLPTVRSLFFHMWDKTRIYLRKMGGVILVASLLLWGFSAFPRVDGRSPDLAESYIGKVGQAMEPVLEPLGFDWRMGVALTTGFVAKEVVVSSLGVLYKVGEETTQTLEEALRASGMSPAAALAFMVFVLLYVPCVGTLIAIWKETGSLKYPAINVIYQLLLAWIVSFLTYRIGQFIIG
ncbi:ferrous iron transport protein B [Thermosulfurimonas dismutans]|uniref:Ferrous iron transport protein B n=1 Tax=Thermosulfurimonas dismutans TaxID=999894 RepID=A0A179D4K9_9BACT|nr:ferrous iron transport protein B [Thermosulfurimonas dismutans]OAQ20659.1 Ferrous iron transport protein B [Thermosulfurimonas dismutans]